MSINMQLTEREAITILAMRRYPYDDNFTAYRQFASDRRVAKLGALAWYGRSERPRSYDPAIGVDPQRGKYMDVQTQQITHWWRAFADYVHEPRPGPFLKAGKQTPVNAMRRLYRVNFELMNKVTSHPSEYLTQRGRNNVAARLRNARQEMRVAVRDKLKEMTK